ncbi:MAG: lipopolysaccharide heptosyltransferase family protein [Proteobacteria bacterium]|nr:MAG: lipopolysaccharide heptosyltransferase family protein [Pseudomonadota bacterium]
MSKPKKILLVQLRQLGDILLTTPSLRELKKSWPDATIDFLCHPMGKLILSDNPYLNQIITYEDKGKWLDKLKFMKRLRAEKYDLVLDFMYNPRSAFYSYCTGAPKRLAFPSRRQSLFTDIVKQSLKVEYIVREKFRYLEHLGLEPMDMSLDLPWNENHIKPTKDFLGRHPLFENAPVRVAISATHRRAERQWPVERYAALADKLVREKKAAIVWLWGPGEEDFVKNAMALCKEPMLEAPKTTFKELAAFLANCDLFIGNSNGPSHVAVANTLSSLQLHGTTYAQAWCPRTNLHRAVQAGANLPEGRGPIGLIQPQELWHALEAMWLEVERVADKRRNFGIKSNWTQRIV